MNTIKNRVPVSYTHLDVYKRQVIVMVNAFSPNGDNVNEQWNISEMNDPDFKGEIQVFNRWGQMVYNFSASHQPWNGLDLTGKKLPIESYHYLIDYKNGKKPIRGVVTILR